MLVHFPGNISILHYQIKIVFGTEEEVACNGTKVVTLVPFAAVVIVMGSFLLDWIVMAWGQIASFDNDIAVVFLPKQ